MPFGGTITLPSLFGVPIRLHFTFLLFIVFLIFVGVGQHQSAAVTALYLFALFGSVLLHELGHALVARRYGIRTVDIVMFPIGGLARMERQPAARQEIWIALAGPAVNLAIAAIIIAALSAQSGWTPLAARLAEPTDANIGDRLAAVNLFLALFNMLPAYPMDGGRVLRGILALHRPEEQATRIAAAAGQWLAIGMGLYGLLSSNFLLVFIAMFVYLGAVHENAAAQGKSLMTGAPVRAAMVTDFRTLSHGATMRDAGDLLLATSQQDFPVVYGETVIGLLSRSTLMRTLLSEGPEAYVSSAMDRNFVQVEPDLDLVEVLPRLGGNCALVMHEGKLLGLLTSENLSEFLVLRQIDSLQQKRHPS